MDNGCNCRQIGRITRRLVATFTTFCKSKILELKMTFYWKWKIKEISVSFLRKIFCVCVTHNSVFCSGIRSRGMQFISRQNDGCNNLTFLLIHYNYVVTKSHTCLLSFSKCSLQLFSASSPMRKEGIIGFTSSPNSLRFAFSTKYQRKMGDARITKVV